MDEIDTYNFIDINKYIESKKQMEYNDFTSEVDIFYSNAQFEDIQ